MPKNPKTKSSPNSSLFLPLLLIIVGSLLLAMMLSFASWKAANKPPKLATREDVIKLQAIVSDIKTKLEDGQGEWQDTSSCTVIKPRLFGDKERYFCEVQYERVMAVTNDDQIKELIDRQVDLLQKGEYIAYDTRHPTLYIDKNDTFHVKQAGSAKVRVVVDDVEQNCALGYTLDEITSDGAELMQRIWCYADTDGTYLQKVDRV